MLGQGKCIYSIESMYDAIFQPISHVSVEKESRWEDAINERIKNHKEWYHIRQMCRDSNRQQSRETRPAPPK